MDKVKIALAALKKYHFWVLSGFIVLMTLLSWAKASTDTASRFAKRKSALDSQANSVRAIAGDSKHPRMARQPHRGDMPYPPAKAPFPPLGSSAHLAANV